MLEATGLPTRQLELLGGRKQQEGRVDGGERNTGSMREERGAGETRRKANGVSKEGTKLTPFPSAAAAVRSWPGDPPYSSGTATVRHGRGVRWVARLMPSWRG